MKALLAGRFSFRFLPASRCRAEMLASVYGAGERERQLARLHSFLHDASAERRFFVIARDKEKVVAFLHICREQRRAARFRIRGLHVQRNFRNQSLATRLLQLACKCVTEFYGAGTVSSFILPANIPSLAAHQYAGFSVSRGGQAASVNHLRLLWREN